MNRALKVSFDIISEHRTKIYSFILPPPPPPTHTPPVNGLFSMDKALELKRPNIKHTLSVSAVSYKEFLSAVTDTPDNFKTSWITIELIIVIKSDFSKISNQTKPKLHIKEKELKN